MNSGLINIFSMKKIVLLGIIAFVLVAISINVLFGYYESSFDEEKSKISVNIGRRLVIDRDTLTIVDYSLFENNYILSNRTKVSFELVEKIKTID